MNDAKPDRRSQRTRRALGEALVALLSKKSYSAITVQAIVDYANVGRTTFYEHFQDKDDLLLSQVTRMLHQLSDQASRAGGPAGQLLPSLGLFRHVHENRALYQAFLWGRGPQHIRQIQAQLTDLLEQRLAALAPDGAPPTMPLAVLANFVSSVFLAQLEWWMSSKVPYTPEQVDAMFWRLVRPGLEAALGVTLEG